MNKRRPCKQNAFNSAFLPFCEELLSFRWGLCMRRDVIEKTTSWLGLGFFWELLGLGLCCFGRFIPGEEAVHTDRPLREVPWPRSRG